jgi:hypothetical protein
VRSRTALLVASLTFAAIATAEVPQPAAPAKAAAGPADTAPWEKDGKPVGDEPWRRSDGDFGAMLFLTDQPKEFNEAWDRPAAPGYTPHMHTVSEAKRGDVVAAIVLFKRCSADPLGNCRSQVQYRVLRPDGSLYGEHTATLWNAPPGPLENLQRGNDQLMLRIEPNDPLGTYRIEAVVRDHIARREVSLLRELVVRGD